MFPLMGMTMSNVFSPVLIISKRDCIEITLRCSPPLGVNSFGVVFISDLVVNDLLLPLLAIEKVAKQILATML